MTDTGASFIRQIDGDRAATILEVMATLPKALVASILAAVREFDAREP